MKRMFMLLALLGLIWSGPAAAQSVKNVLDDFGYVGRWAANCGKAASCDNPLLIVSILPSGVGEHRYDFGPGSTPEINTIFDAKRSDADKISSRFDFATATNASRSSSR